MNKYILFLPLVFILSCTGENIVEKKSTEKSRNVKLSIVEADSISIPVLSVGTLSSKTQSNLSFLTGGIISRILVSEGELVKEGQLLATLDLTEIDSRLQQASLALEKSRRDYRRVENLYQDTVVTLEQFQDAKTALNLAEANYKIAQFNKANSEIRAPSDGKILKKLKENNEIVSSGHPVIIFASTEADWVLKVNLSDRDIVRVQQGDFATIGFDAFPGEEFDASIFEVANAANPLSGTYEVELKLIDLPDKLVTGLIGQARIFPDASNYLLLPPGSLVEASGRQGTVFKIQNGKPMRTGIEISAIINEAIIIKEGLLAGDTVVTDGSTWLKDGENIVPMK